MEGSNLVKEASQGEVVSGTKGLALRSTKERLNKHDDDIRKLLNIVTEHQREQGENRNILLGFVIIVAATLVATLVAVYGIFVDMFSTKNAPTSESLIIYISPPRF